VKRLALAAALLSLTGCSSSGTSDYSQFYQAVRQSIAASFGKAHVTRAQAAAIPYASMGYRVNGGAEQILVLATDTNGEQLWTSGAHIVIVTRGGRIVRTVGLAHDVSAVAPQNGQELTPPATAIGGVVVSARLMDFSDIPAYGAAVTCTATPRGEQTILILGHGIRTIRVDEICHSAELDWSFTNSYWLDPKSGLAWRSIQHIHPKNETIETEILRPPG
jgi:Group 4 capsule polysaccharide lipoprotein gfcB, YjbF